MAVPPEPRLIYSVNKQLDVWVGGEVAGSAFRMDHHDDFQFQGGKTAKLSGAVVDYTDYRAGLGFTFSPTNNIDLDFSGGYSVQRNFDFQPRRPKLPHGSSALREDGDPREILGKHFVQLLRQPSDLRELLSGQLAMPKRRKADYSKSRPNLYR